jgi:hypothetical protein
MFTPVDFAAPFTRRPELFREAYSLVPENLRTDVRGAELLFPAWPVVASLALAQAG